ncbi:hypothetical protein E2C01_043804 [Portunus trituberculatus]|uniref:Uncharacterized protein n=1 Tax=Portunus trituberculatus TaxID=210409 RepID=A0A5B7FWN2_PORTR|nr:hypothetical protein [Portunus trituberculatus]
MVTTALSSLPSSLSPSLHSIHYTKHPSFYAPSPCPASLNILHLPSSRFRAAGRKCRAPHSSRDILPATSSV